MNDQGNGILVTIASVELDNVGTDAEPQQKYIMQFIEDAKPLVLNKTNAEIIAAIVGGDDNPAEDTDQWIGYKIVLYWDKTVQFKGKITGGIRVRAARNATQSPPVPPKAPVRPPVRQQARPAASHPAEAPQPDALNDDVPF